MQLCQQRQLRESLQAHHQKSSLQMFFEEGNALNTFLRPVNEQECEPSVT